MRKKTEVDFALNTLQSPQTMPRKKEKGSMRKKSAQFREISRNLLKSLSQRKERIYRVFCSFCCLGPIMYPVPSRWLQVLEREKRRRFQTERNSSAASLWKLHPICFCFHQRVSCAAHHHHLAGIEPKQKPIIKEKRVQFCLVRR